MNNEPYTTDETIVATNDANLPVTDATATDDGDGTMGQVSGTGAGAISGGVVGGAVGGPIGAVVGAVAGGVLGSAAGEAAHHMGDDTEITDYEAVPPVSYAETTIPAGDARRDELVNNDLPGIRRDEQVYTGNADLPASDTPAAPRYDANGRRLD